MARGKLLFKERDLRRALRAFQKEDAPIQRAEIDSDGRIIVIFGPPEIRECDLRAREGQFSLGKSPK
jgi:hypothetical protein